MLYQVCGPRGGTARAGPRKGNGAGGQRSEFPDPVASAAANWMRGSADSWIIYAIICCSTTDLLFYLSCAILSLRVSLQFSDNLDADIACVHVKY